MLWKTTEYQGWGRVLKATGDVARPERASSLAHIMAQGPAPAFGNRRSYGDAALNDGGRAIDMTRMDKVLAFDASTGVIEVEAGIDLGTLVRLFAPRGWIPAVVPGTGFATVGGAIAQDVHGKNHHVAGSFGTHVISVTLQQGDKRITASPGRNKALFHATMGGLGQTGVILSAKLQMLATPGDAIEVTETRVADWDDLIDALESSTATYAVSWIDAQARGRAFGRGILEEAELTAGSEPSSDKARSVPLNIGLFSSGLFTRVFNAAYFRRIPDGGRTSTKPLFDYFFPLDKVHNMTRLYGKKGFHQFQCVVPTDSVDALRAILERVAHSGLASPLAVLKRMGSGRAGTMSFPMEGFTLAVDVPARRKAEKLIADLEAMTLAAGGRLYLAKDALATEDTIKAMYPDWQDWAAEAAKADPDGALKTDMVRRLKLRDEE